MEEDPYSRDSRVLSAQIKRAFRDVRMPEEKEIVDEVSYRDLERDQVRSLFADKARELLSEGFLIENSFALSFFSAEAYRYFIPVFMLTLLRDYRSSDMLADQILTTIRPLPGITSLLPRRLLALRLEEMETLYGLVDLLKKYHGEDFLLGQLEEAHAALVIAIETKRSWQGSP